MDLIDLQCIAVSIRGFQLWHRQGRFRDEWKFLESYINTVTVDDFTIHTPLGVCHMSCLCDVAQYPYTNALVSGLLCRPIH